ncbi:unnamed protein product [Sphenostylis stenocarpa]|uniref:Protein kinase domain-containing protein n=1 Tax=Sphenostylis stenocarpa TaxID=92480 RepID=A0AA86SVM8_9FABA|nr:unnamed protein product [Sphenostylis stenocarpa]
MHPTFIFLIFVLLLTTLPQSRCQPNDPVCGQQPYNCGSLSNISYPFWGLNRPSFCGGGDSFNLKCHANDATTSIQIGSQNFTVKEINITFQTMRVVRPDLVLNVCSPHVNNTGLGSSLFKYGSSVYNITIFYNCSLSLDASFGHFSCGNEITIFRDGPQDELLRKFPWIARCRRYVEVPVDVPYDNSGGLDFLQQAFDSGFPINYTVLNNPKSVTGATVAGLLICIAIFYIRYRSSNCKGDFGLATKSNKNIEAFLQNQGALTLKRYKLSDVKKMTNNFKVKLGQGGFGIVYQGKLSNGSPVAIKMLNEAKNNGEDFINEVASISRTSHINVVTLLGFCLEGRKRALIYEFMSNGSLDKFIYRKGPEAIAPLSWDNIYQIAMGIARGLEYLHIGCNTRILHFDIKPHNILLDDNLCPKISDFGLAKLCPRNESIISMSDARGTMGYVAPEVLNRHFAGVSHKSDVYSYGMMLLEMVGGRKNINADASHTSEIYFPHWIYKRLELDTDLRLEEEIMPEKKEIVKRLIIVGLWCIQTFPNGRPTMSRVIDMLEANMNSLEIPPKPLLSSPTTSLPESSIS